jgi:trichohyalin
MKTEIIKFNAPELEAIEKSKAEQIRSTFEPMVEMLADFEDAYESIIKASQKEVTKELTNAAKRLRLDIGKIRVEAEKLRKEQKEEYLRAGKAIDAVNNILKWAITDKENSLKEIENFFEIQEQKRLEQLQKERADKLSKYLEDAHERDLASMDEDVWKAYYSTKKQEHEDRIAAEKKAEEERIERERLDKLEYNRRLEIAPYYQFITSVPDLRTMSNDDFVNFLTGVKAEKAEHDKEQERIRKENDRIKKEQEEERIKAEAERKAREEKERKERAAYEAKLKKEREERQRIEAQMKAREETERKAEEEKRKAETAPDKEKLLAFANRLASIEIPNLKSKEAREIVGYAHSAIADIAKEIINITNEKL